MSIAEDTAYMDATAQAELVRKGDVSPAELLEAAIARAEKVNAQLNAIVTPMYEIARDTIDAGLPDGPFKGVPFLLKDLGAQYAGVPTKGGCKLLSDYVPTHDSELVARYKRAGLVTFGKTNTPEFGFQPVTEAELYGPCRSPWNLEHTPGGSSGGAAAAVAAGVVAMAHASDGGGSIRIPASCCGIFGMKPTRARISAGPDFGDHRNGLVNEHAVSLSVRDNAALLDATDGAMLGDPYFPPPKERPYAEEVGADPGKLRIAFTTHAPNGEAIDPECVNAVQETAKLCEELGHSVTEAFPRYDGRSAARSFAALWYAGADLNITAAAALHNREPEEGDVEPLSWGLHQTGRKITAATYLSAVQTLQGISRQVVDFMEDYDVILTPATGEPPLKLGELGPKPDKPMHGFFRSASFVPFTAIFNGTGQPAMSVPLYWTKEDLPIGSHFAGRFGDEATLYRLAAQLEEARPWADRRPTINAG